MEYYKIISVTGFGGLFELVGSKSDGAIVRSLEDKTTKFVSSRVHNFSHLESIEIFTEGDNVNLIEILQAMEASKEALPDEKNPAAVKSYFEKVYPQMDFTRVYASDTKKMVRWFKILKENNIELKLREAEPETEEVVEIKAEEKKQETKVVKETTQKTKAKEKKEEDKVAEAEPEIKKAKKAAAKKPKDEIAEEEKPKKKAAKKKAE